MKSEKQIKQELERLRKEKTKVTMAPVLNVEVYGRILADINIIEWVLRDYVGQEV